MYIFSSAVLFLKHKKEKIYKRIKRIAITSNLINELNSDTKKTNRFLFFRKTPFFKLDIWLKKNGISLDAEFFVILVVVCISIFFLVTVFLKTGFFIFILFCAIFIFLVYIMIDFRGRKINQKKEEQLEGFLIDLMGNMYVNQNVLLGIQKTIETAENPIKQVFEFVIYDVRRGILLNDALRNVIKINSSKIFKIVITGLIAANEKGADIIDFLKDQIDYIREKKSISNYIRVLSSGPRYTSYIIMIVPLIALTLSVLINKGFIEYLFSGLGIIVLVYSVASYVAGFFIINKIINSIDS